MIITKTPFRMSFFGGGTDIKEFYEEYGGSVISTTFDKYCYVNVRHLPRFFEYSNAVVYSKIEKVARVEEIEHPLVREAMKFLDMHEINITYDADLPARSGLGTSSSFAVGLLYAFYALKGKYVGKEKLAKDAIYVERVLCREAGGIQDQIATAFGGLNRINFGREEFKVSPVIISNERKRELNDNLMLFFTGFSRYAGEISRSQVASTREKHKELQEMLGLVNEAEKVLVDKTNKLEEFGRLLDYTWSIKRGITKEITNEGIDRLYKRAKEAGAVGGKLLGAGGGGFLLFYVEKEKQAKVKEDLSDLLYVPFAFENDGTQILYYKPEEYEKK